MFKNKAMHIMLAVGLGFIACMVLLCLSAGKEARALSEEVLRFHIVANSDSEGDQALKMKVRDGLAELTDKLFATAENKAEATKIAKENAELLRQSAEQILRKEGCDDPVTLEIKNLYFPTKRYENVTFPAGNYDAIAITLGEGKGQNFWCVMFPALCIKAVGGDNEALLSEVLGEQEMKMVTRPYTLKFKTAEWLAKILHIFKK